VADPSILEGLADLPDGVRLQLWDVCELPEQPDEIGMVVVPYQSESRLELLAELPNLRLVQTLSAGYENVLPHLPDGVALANAVGVHDASTSELAVGLAIAALRGLPDFVRAQDRGSGRTPSTARSPIGACCSSGTAGWAGRWPPGSSRSRSRSPWSLRARVRRGRTACRCMESTSCPACCRTTTWWC
jgi:lactate dehydrogenase-like 2-hydroxyacid dehydrogenase